MMRFLLLVWVFLTSSSIFSQGCRCLTGGNCVNPPNCGVAQFNNCVNNGGIWFQGGNAQINCMAVLLPVELTHFRVYQSLDSLHIEIATASERNCEKFTITFMDEELNELFSTDLACSGNSSNTIEYYTSIKKNHLIPEYVYLSQRDFDGQMTHYPIALIEPSDENGFFVYPTQVESEIFLSSNEKIARVEIYTLSGAKSLSSTNESNSIDVSGLSEGIYFLHATNEKDKKYIARFYKN